MLRLLAPKALPAVAPWKERLRLLLARERDAFASTATLRLCKHHYRLQVRLPSRLLRRTQPALHRRFFFRARVTAYRRPWQAELQVCWPSAAQPHLERPQSLLHQCHSLENTCDQADPCAHRILQLLKLAIHCKPRPAAVCTAARHVHLKPCTERSGRLLASDLRMYGCCI